VLHLSVSPSEFWNMQPRHFWLLVGAKRDENGAKRKSRLSKADRDAIRAEMMGDKGRWF
jgi:hypothetical protein